MVTVYGGIRNTQTGAEMYWDNNTPLSAVLEDLKSVHPLYGAGWTYAGDCGFEEGNIHFEVGPTFAGRHAVTFAIEYLQDIKMK